MLEICGVVKRYGEREVLRGVDLSVSPGDVYGLVGRNGAGKTTLLSIAAGQLPFEGGEVRFNGAGIRAGSRVAAYFPDIPPLYPYLTANEYLAYLACGTEDSPQKIRERSAYLLDLVGLSGEGNTRIRAMSRGMQQRFGIAAGLYADPAVLLLDEHCSALDPRGRYDVNEIIRKLASEGKTILLSTHILSDVEKVCTRIGLLTNGRIAFQGTRQELFDRYAVPTYEVVSADNVRLAGMLQAGFILDKSRSDTCLYVTIDDSGDNEQKLLALLVQTGIPIHRFGRRVVTLEEIFLREDHN